MTHVYLPGEDALVKGSFEIVAVIAQVGQNVLVRRGSGQITYDADQLEPYEPDICPLI